MDMDRLKKMMFAILCFFICVKAQNASNKNDVNPLHPSMAVVLTVLAIMFCITFLIVAYAKFCQRIEPRTVEVEDPGGIVRSRSRFSGIDRSVIESLPFFRFSSLRGSKEGLECAVCISRFEETEILRLLPKCQHAFHMSCIDKWLDSHSSCPLCRYRINAGDIKSLSSINSFIHPRVSGEDQNLEFFIRREENLERSSRFIMGNTLQKLTKGNGEESLIQGFGNEKEGKILHKFKHRIIVSDVIHKSRWSDVSSSDLMSLSSEMLSALSRKELSSMDSRSGRLTSELSGKEQMLKIKEDMERKRLHESKNVAKNGKCSGESSGCNNIEVDRNMMSTSLDPSEKRSMSEITNISRFINLNTSSRFSTQVNMEKDDKVRRLWLPIARRTIQLFSSQETCSEASKNSINV